MNMIKNLPADARIALGGILVIAIYWMICIFVAPYIAELMVMGK